MSAGWTVDDLPAHLQDQARAQLVPPAKKKQVPAVDPAKGAGARPSKYHNDPTVLDGFKFDSKREAARYQYLKSLQILGTIAGLQLQVPFALVVNRIKVAEYVADFTYRIVDTGESIIEDLKGAKTPVYLLKRNIMDAMGFRIREVTRPTAPAGWDARVQPKRLKR